MKGGIPKLCRHKATGRAYVTDPRLRRPVYLGVWGSPEAQTAYDSWLRQFLNYRSSGSSSSSSSSSSSPRQAASDGCPVWQLLDRYLDFARLYYRKDGVVTSEMNAVAQALWPVNETFGQLDANLFGPAQLKAVRAAMISGAASKNNKPWSRRNINKQIQRIRRVWRWGVEQEMIRPETLAALQGVPGLRQGRSEARERLPVQPVDFAIVEATLPRLDKIVRDMAEIQLYADMRPGEVVIMRPCDIDRSGTPWLYTPHSHKTVHHGKIRRIWIGPRARAILECLLQECPKPGGWLFPSRARGKYSARRTHWTVSGYRKAIRLACLASGDLPAIPRWHPHQLRHLMATEIRKQFGLEAAQVVLGHASADVTQVYAERDDGLAKTVAEKIG